MDIDILDIFTILLFFISFFGLITCENIIKSIVFSLLLQTAVVMAWLVIGARIGSGAPIITDLSYLDNLEAFADPLPQALMITAIVIGVSVTAINITMLNSLLRKYRTGDWRAMRDLVHESEEKEESDEKFNSSKA